MCEINEQNDIFFLSPLLNICSNQQLKINNSFIKYCLRQNCSTNLINIMFKLIFRSKKTIIRLLCNQYLPFKLRKILIFILFYIGRKSKLNNLIIKVKMKENVFLTTDNYLRAYNFCLIMFVTVISVFPLQSTGAVKITRAFQEEIIWKLILFSMRVSYP
jgi:hypothetical protein